MITQRLRPIASLVTAFASALSLTTASGCGGGATIRSVDPDAGKGLTAPDSLYTALLEDHVTAGRVDYASLCGDDRLEAYIGYLERTSPDTMAAADDRLALWINAYNAWTLKLICDNYPVESINELHTGGRIIGYLTGRTVWDRDFAVVGGTSYSLDDIEHDIIRERFDDPRIHFALVCAAQSCPPLRAEAYTGDRLDAQLDDQALTFFSQPEKNRFDLSSKTAHLSKILDWYEDDFANDRAGLLTAIAPYAPKGVRDSLRTDPSGWKVEYTHYDWSLNDLQERSTTGE